MRYAPPQWGRRFTTGIAAISLVLVVFSGACRGQQEADPELLPETETELAAPIGAGEDVEGTGDLRRLLREHEPGDVVTLVVIRQTERFAVRVRLGEAVG